MNLPLSKPFHNPNQYSTPATTASYRLPDPLELQKLFLMDGGVDFVSRNLGGRDEAATRGLIPIGDPLTMKPPSSNPLAGGFSGPWRSRYHLRGRGRTT